MKSVFTLLVGITISATSWAVCPETSIGQDIKKFKLSGKMKIINVTDNLTKKTNALTYKPGSEEYEYIKSEIETEFNLLSDLFIDQVLPIGYYFAQDNKTCENSFIIDNGDNLKLYFVNSIRGNKIYTIEEYSEKQFVFEKK